MIQYKIHLRMESSDGDRETFEDEEVSGENLSQVVDDAIAHIGNWQREEEKSLEEETDIIPE